MHEKAGSQIRDMPVCVFAKLQDLSLCNYSILVQVYPSLSIISLTQTSLLNSQLSQVAKPHLCCFYS